MKNETRNTVKGSARREHFERGGTPQMWRGSSRKFTDKKKEASKNACRNVSEE
jgi:hypothetical protein